ncbi:MAG: phosphoribosylpyrophosphate synthetase [Psychroflexus halocasei]|uniref:phosphoribosylpyrophosphate synthetase n=1 Tax=Psychroflexus sp. S27 TaxID=1982757 RepID=UPI000C2A266E|nr:phosphoribosylpyrophosphate synthetase [Psychroflexus sp. S27]PJX20686.1 phosphoribosylpyrophosphate synthetase [Psychroflexus sp. S27]
MESPDTLSQRMNKLKSEGYTMDFKLTETHLKTTDDKNSFTGEDFIVDNVYRFEGMSNPSDNSILYAITTTDGVKGTLVDGYGVSGGQVSKKIREKLNLSSNRNS